MCGWVTRSGSTHPIAGLRQVGRRQLLGAGASALAAAGALAQLGLALPASANSVVSGSWEQAILPSRHAPAVTLPAAVLEPGAGKNAAEDFLTALPATPAPDFSAHLE